MREKAVEEAAPLIAPAMSGKGEGVSTRERSRRTSAKDIAIAATAPKEGIAGKIRRGDGKAASEENVVDSLAHTEHLGEKAVERGAVPCRGHSNELARHALYGLAAAIGLGACVPSVSAAVASIGMAASPALALASEASTAGNSSLTFRSSRVTANCIASGSVARTGRRLAKARMHAAAAAPR